MNQYSMVAIYVPNLKELAIKEENESEEYVGKAER